MAMHQILILGGTSEARQLAGRLAARGNCAIVLSLAGRTKAPVEQPVPVRTGGFGGAQGLADYLRAESVSLLIDATHPYAAQISRNAAQAARLAGVPLIALRRPAWEAVGGDRWTMAGSVEEAVLALGAEPRRVMVTLGRQELLPFERTPQHYYLIRSVDPVEPPLDVPEATYILGRGPFDEPSERALLEEHRTEVIVSKNSGGTATYAKIAAARELGIEVVMIARPELPDVPAAASVDEVVAMAAHALASLAKRGV
jgi:precorrin-6A/cobalt-precorrin-6A reductase